MSGSDTRTSSAGVPPAESTSPLPSSAPEASAASHGPSLRSRYRACMVISAVGDAVGYFNGRWEFRLSTQAIHDELDALSGGRGMAGLTITRAEWCVSDDTVFHLATAEALADRRVKTFHDLCVSFARHYKPCEMDMTGRAPGKTTMRMVRVLQADGQNWDKIPFNERGGGCGAAMRTACIGLRFPAPEQLDRLISTAIESGRMTHHHPIGYLGALCSAFFTSLALRSIQPARWASALLAILPLAVVYIVRAGRQVGPNLTAFAAGVFEQTLRRYCTQRGILSAALDEVDSAAALAKRLLAGGDHTAELAAVAEQAHRVLERVLSEPVNETDTARFPDPYGVHERDVFYRSLSLRGVNPGSGGPDCVLIAYDGLLGALQCGRPGRHGGGTDAAAGASAAASAAAAAEEGSPVGAASGGGAAVPAGSPAVWEQLCRRAMLHGGDNDTTGAVAGAWYGALFGFAGVPECNYAQLEYRSRCEAAGEALFALRTQPLPDK